MKNVNHQEMRASLAGSLGIDAAYWALGQYFEKSGIPGRVPVWGLFVIEENRDLHFISFNQDNWFSSLMKSARADSGRSAAPEGVLKMHMVFPFSERLSLVRVKKRGIFSFLQKAFPLYHMRMEGRDTLEVFELEDPDREFLEALREGSEEK